MTADVGALVAAAAAVGLPTAPEPPTETLDDHSWSVLLGQMRSHRITGVVAPAVADGSWPMTDDQFEMLAEAHVSQTAWVLQLERRLLALASDLRSRAIPFRVLKGSALAHLDYADPAQRCFGDVDLVVPASRFAEAAALLEEQGGARKFPEPRPGFDARFSKGACFRMPDAHEVDLHRTLVLGWFGLTVDPDDFFTSAETFTIGSAELAALDRPERLVHACIHASLGTAVPRWLPLRDVAELVLGTEHIEPVLARARAWQCQVVVADAVRQTWDRLALSIDHDLVRWARDYPETPRERARIAAYHGDHRSHARMALAASTAVPHWPDRVRYLRAILLPQRARGRMPTKLRLRHGVDAIRTWSDR